MVGEGIGELGFDGPGLAGVAGAAGAAAPRGSNPTRSNRWVTGLCANAAAVVAAKPIPGLPGPPELSTSDPIDSPRAGARSTAIRAVAPAGSA